MNATIEFYINFTAKEVICLNTKNIKRSYETINGDRFLLCKTNEEFAAETRCPKRTTCQNCNTLFQRVTSFPAQLLIEKFYKKQTNMGEFESYAKKCRDSLTPCSNEKLKNFVKDFLVIFSKDCVRTSIASEIERFSGQFRKLRMLFETSANISPTIFDHKLFARENRYLLFSICLNILSASFAILVISKTALEKNFNPKNYVETFFK